MKCEKCERELPGETVICSDCGHDSSLRKATLALAEEQARLRTPVLGGGEANLIRFPKTSNSVASAADVDSVPVWRDAVKERVRQFREQRPEAPTHGFAADDVPTNPIVEAALRRLNKPTEQFAETRTSSHSALATAPLTHERAEAVSDSMAAAMSFRRDTSGLIHQNQFAKEASLSRIAEPSSGKYSSPTNKVEAARSEAGVQHSLQPLHPPQPATLWDRTLAGLFDFTLVFLACIPLYSIHSITGLRFGQSAAYAVLGIAVWITFSYQVWTMLVSGRTCGMAWRHLRVFDAETRDPRFAQWRLFVRAICGPVSLLFPPLNLAVIWASGNQAGLADLLSRTTLLQTHTSVSSPSQI